MGVKKENLICFQNQVDTGSENGSVMGDRLKKRSTQVAPECLQPNSDANTEAAVLDSFGFFFLAAKKKEDIIITVELRWKMSFWFFVRLFNFQHLPGGHRTSSLADIID